MHFRRKNMTLTEASSEPVAKASPFGWNLSVLTSASCPSKLCTHCPVRISQTSACLSAPSNSNVNLSESNTFHLFRSKLMDVIVRKRRNWRRNYRRSDQSHIVFFRQWGGWVRKSIGDNVTIRTFELSVKMQLTPQSDSEEVNNSSEMFFLSMMW